MAYDRRKEALDYHEKGRKGKIEVVPTKPYATQRDLALAYSPGVAEPCKEIAADVNNVYKYTAKQNLVAVISNGTAVLGLGNLGPHAAKPVMEGKGLLFKIFADIDVFDIELDADQPELFIQTVKAMAPTFGGINLEDIKAPEAFEIEERLKAELDIPIMHDDQHGTAIISGAALLNALELADKKINEVKIIINGAGAAAISCAKIYLSLGVKKENLFMLDSKGLLTTNREGLDKYKSQFAIHKKDQSLDEVIKGADVFLGLSVADILTPKMLKEMAKNPIVFACANPDPEIDYKLAIKTRKDVIMATGRSDYPNQVNNVLGFPYIFRGALDVRASTINEEMKLAAVYALANLAKERVPEEVKVAYGAHTLAFGKDSIIPKPLDPRLITEVSIAVAKAAIASGVAKEPITDWEAYEVSLKKRLGLDQKFVRNLETQAKKKPKRVVFAEADNYKILRAAEQVLEDELAIPILLGNKKSIQAIVDEYKIELPGVEIIDPKSEEETERRNQFGDLFFEKRQRKGVTQFEARKLMRERPYFGSMMVSAGYADAVLSGISRSYGEALKPALQTIGCTKGVKRVAGMYIILTKEGPKFFADTTVNMNPSAEEIAEITLLTAATVKRFGITPKIALLSYSNFGSAKGEEAEKMQKACALLHQSHPNLIVDGEIQANFALNKDLLKDKFPFSRLVNAQPNTLIFPNLSAGNIAYKIIDEMTPVETIGPILMGMDKPFHVLTLGCSVKEIVNMVTIAVLDAQQKKG